jgi:c(7)-type cytochrome triheme protein
MPETREPEQVHPDARPRRRGPRWLAPIILAAACAGFGLTLLSDWRASAAPGGPRVEDAGAGLLRAPQDYSKFPHTEPGHARLPCLLCHRREDNSPRPRLPGHAPCAGCHAQQFNDSGSPICTICHTDARSGAVKPFPPLKSFNVMFDHARHTTAVGAGCATCHKPARGGVALSIPAGLSGHATCFQCHSPRAQSGGRDISSCGACHHVGGYARTPEWTQAYRVNFSHATHGARRRLNCNSCHQVRAGQPQRRQVTSPAPEEHNRSLRARSCLTCHDGKRAFGGYDFASCKRCHLGRSFSF